MDTSKEYIKMCEKAKPFWTKEFLMDLDHNTFWAQKHNGEWVVDIRSYIPKEDIPLLRQDQSQETIKAHVSKNYSDGVDPGLGYVADFFDWWINGDSPNYPQSMEILWLAYVMKEKFNKIWDGEDWRSDGIPK